jgi:DNA-binding LacI/PurR family transcriptional regulator
MVSLSDVARSAHVSKMTVSRVINHPEQVSLEIRTEVQRVINQLGYVQNRAGRALPSFY